MGMVKKWSGSNNFKTIRHQFGNQMCIGEWKWEWSELIRCFHNFRGLFLSI